MDDERHNHALVEIAPIGQVVRFLSTVDDIPALIAHMKTLPQVEMPVQNIFAGGIYIRQITIPAGSFCVGKIHRHKTVDIVLSGSMLIYSGFGIEPSYIKAPMIFETSAGKQKMGYALEDTVWMNCFPTNETDLEILEKDLYVEEGEELCLL